MFLSSFCDLCRKAERQEYSRRKAKWEGLPCQAPRLSEILATNTRVNPLANTMKCRAEKQLMPVSTP